MTRRSVLAMAAALAATGAGAREGALARYRWRSRVVVVFAAAGDPRPAEQARGLERLAAGGDTRDLVLVQVVGEHVAPPIAQADDLRRELKVQPGRFAALLVGKDGGVKLRRDAVLGPDLLRDTIDAMPMRRDEMNGRLSG